MAVIAYDIVVRSIRVDDSGADNIEYILANMSVPDDVEFIEVMREMAESFRAVATKLDEKLKSL